MNPGLTKSFNAEATINPCRFIKAGAADNGAIQATDGAAPTLGVTTENISAASGGKIDCVMSGIAYLELGGSVTRGGYLKPDANGKGVAVTIVAGTPVYLGAKALVSGVAGDIIAVHVFPSVVGNDTGIVTDDITITTGQLLALNATPKTLVAAPGAGKIIVVEDVQVFYDYNSAAYAGIAAGEDLEIRYTDGSGQLVATIETTGFLDLTADAYRHARPATTAAITPVANAALIMCLASGEIITGDSPLKVRLRYRLIDAAW